MAKNNMVATDISSDSSSTIAQQKLKKFWTRGFQEKMAHVLAMCISFKMVKYNIYIYRKQRVPDIWRTSNQSKIEHRWVRTNPTNQGRIYDYVFSSNRKKVNSLFFPFMATLKKTHSTGIFHEKAGETLQWYIFFLCFCPDGTWLRLREAGACFGPWSQGFPGELSVKNASQPSSLFWATYPNPPLEQNSRPYILSGLISTYINH